VPDLDRQLGELLALNPEWDTVGVIDTAGRFFSRAPKVEVSGIFSDRDYFAGALASTEPYTGQVVVSRVTGKAVATIAVALREGGHLPRIDAALRLASEPRRAYAGLIDEQVLEFLLVALLAFQRARPEYLGELEGSASLLERLERQFPPERLAHLRAAAVRLAGELGASAVVPPRARRRQKRKL